MIRIEKVNGKNVWDLLKLKVSDEQRNFVASNDISIIEAYTAITGNGYAFPFGIYEEDKPVAKYQLHHGETCGSAGCSEYTG
jgi:diamine N-acetyltransferase